MSNYNYMTTEQIDTLRDEAINAATSLAFGDLDLIPLNTARLDLAMKSINDHDLYFTRLAILEEMDNILTSVQEMDDATMSLAYKHYEYSNNSQSRLTV